MGFLDTEYNLTGTTVSSERLNGVRDLWRRALGKAAPDWLERPRGWFGRRWYSESPVDAAYIVELTAHLTYLYARVSPDSRDKLERKLDQLLEIECERQADELISELVLGAVLAESGVVEVEPLVPLSAPRASLPPSPDFAMEVQGQRAMFEVTVFHMERLREWEAAVRKIERLLQRQQEQHHYFRDISVTAPLALRQGHIIEREFRALGKEIARVGQGDYEICADSHMIKFTWSSLPIEVSDPRGFSALQLPNGRRLVIPGEVLTATVQSVGMHVDLPKEELNELFLRSLRHTLNEKRQRQLRGEGVNILVIKPGQKKITPDHIRTVLHERIFPNQRYSWLSGVVILEMNFFGNTGFKGVTTFTPNPNASCPLMLEGWAHLLGLDDASALLDGA